VVVPELLSLDWQVDRSLRRFCKKGSLVADSQTRGRVSSGVRSRTSRAVACNVVFHGFEILLLGVVERLGQSVSDDDPFAL